MVPYLVLALFLLGIWGLIYKENLVKKVIALSLVNAAMVILFVWLGSLAGSSAPISLEPGAVAVDPLPQALMLTMIVIGISVTALALVLVVRIHRSFGTLDLRRIERAMKEEDERDGGRS